MRKRRREAAPDAAEQLCRWRTERPAAGFTVRLVAQFGYTRPDYCRSKQCGH
jgi:hypothetical protein